MRRTLVLFTLAVSTALGLLGSTPSPVAAADGYTNTAATTYVLDPAKAQLRVTVTVTVKNQTPPRTETYPCVGYRFDPWYGYMPYPSVCERTVSYYFNSTAIWVENEATAIKATANGKSLKLKPGTKGTFYRPITITYPNLTYGKTRTIKITYTVKGGAPRSESSVRTLAAYASFCVIANGEDGATVTLRAPSGFDFETYGSTMTSKADGAQRVYSSGRITGTASYYTCFDGTNPSGYRTESLTAPDGRSIRLQSWPEDADWATGVKKEVLAGLPDLAALIGRNMAGTAPLTVTEASTGTEYAGFYNEDTNTITVGEDYLQASLVEHELAHAWFNGSVFKDTWLVEGYAEWSGRDAADDQRRCTRVDAADVELATWKYLTPRSTAEDRAAVDVQYDAACWVVTQVAGSAKPAGMAAALEVLFEGHDPYAADPMAKRPPTNAAVSTARVASWQDWLDAIDEVGLTDTTTPATFVSDLLVTYGATDAEALLDQRAEARAAYHELLASVGDWVVPAAVRAPMAAWEFRVAQEAIAAAPEAYELTGTTDATLAGIDARTGPVAEAWADAGTAADLEAAGDLAQAQLDAAKDVVAAQAEAARPLDFVEQVGLLGATIPSLDPALDAVRAAEADAAAAITASVRASIGGLRGIGEGRLTAIGIGVAVVVVLLLLVVMLLVRRRRGRRPAAVLA